MCEQDDFDAMVQYQRRSAALSRREFGALSMGAGLLSLVPAGAYAAATTGADVDIKTPDGTCDAYFVHPAKGKHPAVLIWPDIFGLRPAFKQMATRLAESGYSVLVINPFYRIQKAPTSTTTNFDATTRAALIGMMGSLSPTTVATDAAAFIPWLDSQRFRRQEEKAGDDRLLHGRSVHLPGGGAVPGSRRCHRDLPRCRSRERFAGQPGAAGAEDEGQRADRHRRQR